MPSARQSATAQIRTSSRNALVVVFELFLPLSVPRPAADRPIPTTRRPLRVLGDAGIRGGVCLGSRRVLVARVCLRSVGWRLGLAHSLGLALAGGSVLILALAVACRIPLQAVPLCSRRL